MKLQSDASVRCFGQMLQSDVHLPSSFSPCHNLPLSLLLPAVIQPSSTLCLTRLPSIHRLNQRSAYTKRCFSCRSQKHIDYFFVHSKIYPSSKSVILYHTTVSSNQPLFGPHIVNITWPIVHHRVARFTTPFRCWNVLISPPPAKFAHLFLIYLFFQLQTLTMCHLCLVVFWTDIAPI